MKLSRALVIAAVAACTAPMTLDAVPASAAGATSCAPEQYEWLGQVVLGVGDSFGTGVIVPERLGSELILSGSSYSADPVDAAVISISVGGVAALEEAVVRGGELVATNIGAASVTLTTVGVAVQRCSQVAQAAPVALPIPSGPLPQTGRSLKLAMAAALCCIVGGVLVRLGRRPVPA